MSRMVWYAPDGSDLAGDGSQRKPFQTAEAAELFSEPGDLVQRMDAGYFEAQRAADFDDQVVARRRDYTHTRVLADRWWLLIAASGIAFWIGMVAGHQAALLSAAVIAVGGGIALWKVER